MLKTSLKKKIKTQLRNLPSKKSPDHNRNGS